MEGLGYFYILFFVAGIWGGISSCCAAGGQDLYLSGDYTGALTAFTEELSNVEGIAKAPVLNNIGTCYVALGELEKAAGYYQQAVKTDPSYGRGWINLGVVQEELGKPDESLMSYGKVTSADPAIFADSMVKTGTLLSGRGKFDEARAAFEAGKPGASGHVAADLYTGIGAIALMQKDPDSAEQAFLQAIKADPNGAVMALTNLGVLDITQGRYDDARTAFETAVSHDPSGQSVARQYLTNLETMMRANNTSGSLS